MYVNITTKIGMTASTINLMLNILFITESLSISVFSYPRKQSIDKNYVATSEKGCTPEKKLYNNSGNFN